MTKQKSNI